MLALTDDAVGSMRSTTALVLLVHWQPDWAWVHLAKLRDCQTIVKQILHRYE
jgi:hypothetical protein